MLRKSLYFIAIILLSKCAKAQLYFDKQPYNSIYSEVQFADLPDPEAQRKGHVFFIIKQEVYDNFARGRSLELLKQKVLPFLPTKFVSVPYIFTNYQVNVENLVSANHQSFKSLSDTLFVNITAIRNKKCWSWRSFSRKLCPVGTDTLYQGHVVSALKLQPSRIIYDLNLFCDNASVMLTAKHGSPIVGEHSTFGFAADKQSLTLPINELLPRQHYLVHKFQITDFNIALTREGITMYTPVKD